MFYRENGQYKTSYAADAAIFPIRQDKIAIGLLLLFAFAGALVAAELFLPTHGLLGILALLCAVGSVIMAYRVSPAGCWNC